MTSELTIRNSTIDFLVFTKQAGEDGINVHVEDETVWVTVEAIAKLFDRARTTITEHIQNIYISGSFDWVGLLYSTLFLSVIIFSRTERNFMDTV